MTRAYHSSEPGHGFSHPRYTKGQRLINVAFDDDATVAEIRRRAIAGEHSLQHECRLLIERGLKADQD